MPIWILILDYILGIIMWTLIGRSAMNIFQREDSNFFFMKAFVKLTNPIIKLFKFITPSFIIPLFVPLYVAWFFYMFRFYAMPYILGYDVMGMLSFPLESDIAQEIYREPLLEQKILLERYTPVPHFGIFPQQRALLQHPNRRHRKSLLVSDHQAP